MVFAANDTVSNAFVQALAQGIERFNRQDFYEAHEAWEAGWIDELSDDRLMLQGLIQAAAGFYKLQTGAPQGTAKLLDAAMKKLRPFVDRSHGVSLKTLLPELEVWQREAEKMAEAKRADYDPKRLPRILFQN